MEEQFVSFEIAKLAKEKGFDIINCNGYYHLNKGYVNGFSYCNSDVYKQSPSCLLAPTQSLLQKWLREKHNINIVISTTDGVNARWSWTIWYGYATTLVQQNLIERFNNKFTYEQSLEKGLYEALCLIQHRKNNINKILCT